MKKILLIILVFISTLNLIYSININSCQPLSTANEIYYLTADITDHAANTCFDITANNITFDCQGNTIDSNDIYDYAIRITRGSQETTNITVRNCILKDWDYRAFYMNNANGNLIENVNLSSNVRESFVVSNSDYNIFDNLDLVGTSDVNSYPLQLSSSDYNNFTNIDFYSNGRGIYANLFNNNIFDNLYISSISRNGFYMNQANNNQIINSYIRASGTYNPSTYAMQITSSSNNNYIYNNVFNNSRTLLNSGSNFLDNGTIGNYWYTPAGNGYSEYCADDNSDTICDTAYSETSFGFTDNYPFAKLNGQGPTYSVKDCRVFDVPGNYFMTQDVTDIRYSYCMKIISNNVTLDCQGYQIDGYNDNYNGGIRVARSSQEDTNVTIRNCVINDWNAYALQLSNSNDVIVEDTNITSNTYYAMYLNYVDNSLFRNVRVQSVSDVNQDSVRITNSDYNNFTDSSFISLNNDISITIASNNIFDNIYVSGVRYNGIYFNQATNNQIINSYIRASGYYNPSFYGIHFSGSSNNNYLYNNILNNSRNIMNSGSNFFDNGTIGNYWYEPGGTGFSDTCPDNNMDNFCDNPPNIENGATDNYPLTVSIPVNPYYVFPTPADKSKISSNSIIFRVGNASSASWINLSLDGINYSLTNQGGGLWDYSLDTSNITTPTNKMFYVYYAGDELEQRNITIYPSKTNNQDFPSIGIGSLIISVMVFILVLFI